MLDKRKFTDYTPVIISFRHKGLRQLYERDDMRGVRADLAARLRRILLALDTAEVIADLRLFPGWRVHRFRGGRKDYWSLSVSGNWRIVFRFDDGDASDVDLLDYH